MAQVKLTLEEARKNPSAFMYIFTDFEVSGKSYLSWIPTKYAKIIRGKRGYQQKLLINSAKAYLGNANGYKQYVEQIREGFKDIYGMEPEQALVKLACGETVAGKNFEEGVFGVGDVGALYPTTFKNVTINDQPVTVDPQTGHIFAGDKDITDESLTVYKDYKDGTKAFQLFSDDSSVFKFMSQYYKAGKKYYAKSWTDADGARISANGTTLSSADAGSVWENIQLGMSDFIGWLKTLLALLGVNINLGTDDVEQISASNTLPSQTADGYATEAGWGESLGTALLIAAAAGTILVGGLGKKKSKSK